ncbi:MAG: DUF2334 domain-containing protein [Lachnospiraceae bacterium]|nr:DUF2334 domain-containing protein [Lachnospiraceae bacterium]
MQCVIRLDDITPDMDPVRFERVRKLFDEYNVRPLIGVVPECRDDILNRSEPDPDFWSMVKELEAKGWKIAQHGTYHVYETEDSGLLGINPFSEFAGLQYHVQLDKIRKGRAILESNGIHTDIFMAPGHTFDDNTVEALKETGFTSVTDGLYVRPYIYKGLLFVPCRLNSNYTIEGFDTICLHTNLMEDKDFVDLERFLREHRDEIIDYDADFFELNAEQFNSGIRRYERKVLTKRLARDKVANNAKLAWYMSYTDHPNSKVKWMKRAVMIPLLLTNKYRENNSNGS